MFEWTEPEYSDLSSRMVPGYLYAMVDVWPEHEAPIDCAYCGRNAVALPPDQVALQLLTIPKPGWGKS